MIDVLGLFPAFDSERFGGIQSSGREAWGSLAERFGAGQARLVEYRRGQAKASAALAALRNPRTANVVVWHLQLAKLLPLISVGGGRVAVFLHGIEAWARVDRLTRAPLKRANLFLSNSEYTWSRFVSMNPEFAKASHRTVPLGLGSAAGGAAPKPDSVPAVCMISRLNSAEDYKGHREMIAAWPLVLAGVPDAELWIVGEGDLRPRLEELSASVGVADRVRFFGGVSEEEKKGLLAQSRCLALPSAGEGFGLVYLEAMRLGRPCLVSDLDAGREVVNPPEAGLAVNPRDARALAGAILRLMGAGPEWDRWSEQARARYESQFTAGHFRRRFLAALMETR